MSECIPHPSRNVEFASCFLDIGQQIIAAGFRIIALIKRRLSRLDEGLD